MEWVVVAIIAALVIVYFASRRANEVPAFNSNRRLVKAYVEEATRKAAGHRDRIDVLVATHPVTWQTACDRSNSGWSSPDDVWAAERACLQAASEKLGLGFHRVLDAHRERVADKMVRELRVGVMQVKEDPSRAQYMQYPGLLLGQVERMSLMETSAGKELAQQMEKYERLYPHI